MGVQHERDTIYLCKIDDWLHEVELLHNYTIVGFGNPDMKILASIGHQDIILWNTETGVEVSRCRIEVPVFSMTFNRSGDRIALGLGYSSFHLKTLEVSQQGARLQFLEGTSTELPPGVIMYHEDDLYLYSAAGTSIETYRGSDPLSVEHIHTTHKDYTCEIERVSPNHDHVVCFNSFGFIVYDLVNHGTAVFGDIQGMVRCCAFTPCSNYIVVVANSEEITVWSLSTGRMVHRIQTVDQVRGIWFCESPRLTCLLLTPSDIVSIDFENEIRDESAEGRGRWGPSEGSSQT